MRKFYFLLIALFFSTNMKAQTVLISPTGDGGFENGSTFAANGWTGVNGALSWYTGTAALTNGTYSFAPTGTNCIYLSSITTPNSWQGGSGTTTASTGHFYRDVTFPSGNNLNNLSFRWAAGGEVSYDELLIYLCPTTLTPVSGSPSSTSTAPTWTGTGTATLLGRFNFSASTGQTSSVSIPSSVIGNASSSSTMRLVFTWKNDGSGGTAPGIAIDDIALNSSACNTNPITGTKFVGPSGDYTTLTAAINDINARGVNGNVFLELNASYTSASEVFPITLGLNPCMGAGSTVTIRPASGVSTPLSITSSSTLATIDLNGGTFYRIDGRPGGAGTTSMLSIVNTSTATGGSAVRFINDASNNIITYTGLKATYRSASSGVVVFSTGLVNGNDNNEISYCNIDGSAGSVASPTASSTNAIYGSGSTSTPQLFNSGNLISNNNIFDFFGVTTNSAGILLASGNTDWIIQSNRVYQTATRTFTSTSLIYYGIAITNSGSANMLITNNIIGFANSLGTGRTIITGSSNMIWGISIFPNSIISSTVSNNTITAFDQTSSRASTTTASSTFYGIRVGASGLVTISGNTIGSQDNSTSILINSTATGTITPSAGIITNSTTAQTITNNTIGSISVTGTGTGLGFRGIHVQTSAGVINTISGNTIGGATLAAGISISSSGGQLIGIHSQAGRNTVSQNTIRNISHTGANTGAGVNAAVIGILNNSVDAGFTISTNVTHSLSAIASASATTVIGIANAGATTGTNIITRNSIYNLSPSANSSSVLNGLLASSGSAVFSNNMVRLGLDAAGASISTALSINGILDQGTNNDYYFNTIHINGSVTGTTTTSNTHAFNSSVTTLSRKIQNNVFSNERSNVTTGGKHYAVRVAGTGTSPAGLTLDYNDYYASGASTVFGFYNADVSSLSNWRTAVGLDVNSIDGNPLFVAANASSPDLHLTTGTPCEGIGVDISSITVDIDDQLRGANTPVDIGADAGNFMSSPAISFTPLSSTCQTSSRTLIATITDSDGVPSSGAGLPVLYWKVGTGSYSPAVATSLGSNQYQFTFGGGVSSGDIISYYVVAQDNLGNIGSTPALGASGYTLNPPAATTAPIAPFTYSIIPTLSGNYTVGVGGTYTTLTAAIAAYNNNCLGGPVTFLLTDATYPSETYPIVINQNAQASATNSLTIKPAPGISPVISGLSTSTAVLVLNGADYVTIDGSNTIGGTTRDLTIRNINTSTNGVVTVWIASQGVNAGATNNNIRNSIIEGPAPGSSTLLSFALYIGSNSGPNGPDNDNITIQNNIFRKAYYGIQAVGATGAQIDNLVVSANTFGSSTATDYLGFIGMFVGEANGAQIAGNTISNIITGNSNPTGLVLGTGTINTTVSNNVISGIRYTGTSGFGGKGMDVYTGNASSNLTIANNMISDIRGDGWSSLTGDGVVGMRIGANSSSNITTGGVKLYYNTVNLGSGSFTGNSSGTLSAALFLSSSASNLDIRNNIFASNLVNSSAATAKTYAIYSSAASSAFSNINNNAYSISGTQGVPAFLGSDQTTLTGIQTAFTGNTNSTLAIPSFVNQNTDLHLTNGDNLCLNGKATPIAGITADIDGNTRNATRPDIGADEFTASEPTFVASNQSACFGQTVDLTSAAVTNGSATGLSYSYFTDAACTNAVATPTAVGAGTYYIRASSGGCFLENIQTVIVTINALPTVSIGVAETSGTTANDGTICAGDAATLTASGAATYVWSTTATTAAITESPATTTTYTVTGTDANGCQNTASTTITVNALPVASIVVAETSGTTNNDGTICAGDAASLTASGGTSYSWSNGATTAAITVSPSSTTTYTVTVTDGNGCISTASTTITVNALPITYNVTGGGAYCSGGVGSLIGLSGSDSGVSYELYFGGSATGNIVTGTGSAISFGTITTAGTYTVVASNATTGCSTNMSGTASVSINQLPTISTSLTQPTTCVSNDGGATLTLGGAAGPYTFNWTGAGSVQGQQDQTTLIVGTSSVVVTAANGCQASASFTLIGPGGCTVCPTIGAATTTPSAICEGGSAALNATGLADLGISYGIGFVVSSTPLANPYTGTIVATVANGSLTNGGSTATSTYAFNTPGTQYVYSILSPAPADPACRPFQATQINVVATPDVNAVANQTVCSNSLTSAVTFSGTQPGTVYTWTNNNTSIGLAASGTGNIPSFTATNFTNVPVTATVTVTPNNPIPTQVSQTFSYTGAAQTWTVPAGVTSIDVEANGAQGGRVDISGYWSPCCLDGGLGGKVQSKLAVTPGQVLNIYVGGIGFTNGTGGYNGGGTAAPVPVFLLGGAGGGGATDIRIGGTALSNRVIVAGAGGGAGGDGGVTAGGVGGGLIGGAPGTPLNASTVPATGGTQTAGGTGGSLVGFSSSGNGSLGLGGNNLSGDGVHSGGGAGYYGGGGGTWAGGAGGSSYTDPTLCSNVTHVQGANTGDGSLKISYNIASSVTCPGPSKTFTITANPIPTVNTVEPVAACNGATVSVPFSGFVPGTVYSWTNSNTAIGLAASGTGNLSFAGINSGTTPITANIIVTPSYTNNGQTCTGTPVAFTITINPTPTVNTVASETLCSGGATTAVAFSGAVTGTVYNWTNNTPSIGLAASGTGDIASFTAVNTGTAPVVATITVTPSYTSGGATCTGTAITYTITVSPLGQVNVVSNQVICNGSSTSPIVFSTPNTGGYMSYTWTNSNPAIGLAATGGGNIASFVGVNNGTTPAIATITVTPTASSAPMPELLYYKFDGTGTSVPNHASNPPAGTAAGTLLGSLTQGSTGLCGGALIGTGTQFDRMSTGWATNFTGSWTLSFWLGNNQFDNNPSYLFGDDAAGAFRCFYGGAAGGNNVLLRGGSSEISVGGVNPASTLITFVYNGTSTDVYKNGQFYQNFPVTFTNAGSGPFFIGGYNGQSQNSFTGKLDEFRLYNRALSSTEVAALTTSCLNCSGTPSTFTITVNPTPTVNAVSNQVVCNGASTSASFTGAVSGTVYNWTNSNTAIGLASSGSGNIPSFAAVNTGTTPVTATVTVTPTTPGLLQYTVYSTHGGNGNTSQYPPHANNAADFAAIFNTSNTLTTVHASGSSTPGLLFNWTGAGQLISGGIPVPNNGEFFGVEITGTFVPVETGVYSFGVDGDDAVDVSINGTVVTSFYGAHGFGGLRTGDVSLVAGQTYILRARQQEFGGGDGLDVRWKRPSQSTYTIQPEEIRGCTGTPTTFTITVNPTPTVNAVTNQTLCNGAATTAVTFGGAVTGTVYNWTNNTTSIGLAASGTGNIASFTATNTTSAPVTATITVTPSFLNGGTLCTGTPRTFTITVNPTPTAVATPASQTICSANAMTTIALTGTVTGTTYSWTRDNTTSVTGIAASGTGNISGTLTNTTNAPVTVTFTITPSANGCTGTPITATVLVNPTPNAVATPAAQTICTGSAITTIALTGNVAGTTYSWTRDNTATVTGIAASGTGNISGTLTNTTTAPVTVTFTITPSANGCTGTPITATVIVNPIPTVNQPANQVVCNRSNTTAVAYTGAVTGTVYSWTNNTPSIGLAASGSGNIAAFTAVNTTQTPVVATITVTPSFTNGGVTCTGTPRTFTITVNPTPIVVATDLFNQRICISDGPVALNATPVGGTWSGIGVSGFNFIPSATAVGNFVLTYTYTNQFGCASTDTTTAKVSACDERNRSLEAGGAILYPNPNGGQFNIRVNSTRFQFLQMRIYNALGQLVSTKQWNGLVFGQIMPVDMRHLAAGVYTVRIIYDGGNLYEDRGYQMLITH